MDDLRFEPVGPERWGDLVRLFGPSGAYSGCWCMFLRESAREFGANCGNGGAGNRARLKAIVDSGRVPGLLAYHRDEPVGWVSVSPREDYPRLLRSPLHRPVDDAGGVWSIACFFIARTWRGRGIASALLGAAVDYAAARGASIVEAYPTDTLGERKVNSDMWRGAVAQFEAAGFTVVARRRRTRPIVRLRTGRPVRR